MSPGDYLTLKYDAWNRPVVWTDSVLGTLITFEYDGLGQRIRKVRVHAIVGGGAFDYYYNDKWQLLTEVKDGSVEAIYHWHPHYVDALAVRMRASDTHFFLQDANFNVTAAVNDDGNAVDERYAYSAYGEVTFLEPDFDVAANQRDGVIFNRHLYTGREREPENALQLNRNRYYSPPLGRWLKHDPIEYRGGTNLYNYVLNRPTFARDPLGLDGPFGPINPPPIRPLPFPRPNKSNKKTFLGFNWCICPEPKKDRLRPIPGQTTLAIGSYPIGPGGGSNTHYPPIAPGGPPIGAGGCATCIGLVIKCPGGIAVYHFASGDDAINQFRGQNWTGCTAIVCGGDDSKESHCLADHVLIGALYGGIDVVGVSPSSACGVLAGGGWYVGN
jgi:RHS repeat-associated protein